MSSLWTSLCAAGAIDSRFGNVDETRLAHALQEPGQWFTVGRDGDGTYYSPLHLINAGNVAGLGFAWEYRTNTSRGMAATPLVVDGVMYTSGNRGVVYALDAATGKPIWVFDPLNKAAIGRAACCDVVNRGVAVWKGKVYVASTNAQLFALDAKTGAKIWEVDTLRGEHGEYSSTGAPQIAGAVVIIGNAGGDMNGGGTRGFITATYEIEGTQYVAMLAGRGGAAISAGPAPSNSAASRYDNANRIIALKLGGSAVPKPPLRASPRWSIPPPAEGDAATIQAGERLFIANCARCHAFGATLTADLSRLNDGIGNLEVFKAIVL